MATSTIFANGDIPSVTEEQFFKIGEIRPPQQQDFDYFLQLADNHEGWTEKHTKNNVKVWMKDTPGSNVKMLKVIGLFKNMFASILFDTVQDSQYRFTWDDAVMHDKTVCVLEGANSDIGYYAMKCPAPLRNRDFVYQRCWRITPDEYITFNHTVAHEDFPPTQQFIRGVSKVTGFIIRQTSEGCSACYITHADPRGKVPKWLLNLVASKIAPRVFQKIFMAAKAYPDWKCQHRPGYKPWLYPERYGIPVVSISSLTQFSDDNIPLTPTRGESDDLGDEEMLEDSEEAPEGLAMDPMLLANGVDDDKEDIMS